MYESTLSIENGRSVVKIKKENRLAALYECPACGCVVLVNKDLVNKACVDPLRNLARA